MKILGGIMVNWKNGIVSIDNELIVRPGYSWGRFIETSFFSGQDVIREFILDRRVIIDNHKYAVSIYFSKQIVNTLSLVCCDIEYSMEREKERKTLHDKILQQYGLAEYNKFSWGKIISSYDEKGNVSSIDFYYDE